jgi:RNA methyltransferase, TrmH family
MITSTSNSKIKTIRHLQNQGKARREQKSYVIEGIRLVEEALQQGLHPNLLIYTDSLDERGEHLLDVFRKENVQINRVSDQVFQAASDTETPQGILGVVPIPSCSENNPTDFLVIADQIRDPGNLGTILRSALAAGAGRVLLPPGTVDPYSPKVVRAGMGAHFRLVIQEMDWDQIRETTSGMQVLCASMNRGISIWEADLTHPSAVIIGSEAHGPGDQARSLTDTWVHIPMPGDTESLNAAVAAGVILFEVVRQRSSGQPTQTR